MIPEIANHCRWRRRVNPALRSPCAKG